ncbi:MAG TPA: flavodoxin domain-containing protein, partial [Fodinibius sp.]|nr:flavodoxin domain-containing protein [Fodinibius sp.]
MDNPEASATPIRILYGTVTGNSEILAEEAAEKLTDMGLTIKLSSTEDFNAEELYQMETLLFVVSTDSGGVPPWMAEDFYKFLNEKVEPDLNHLSYSVLALGDSYYPEFCQAGKDFDHMLEELGAHRLAERVDCDIRFW